MSGVSSIITPRSGERARQKRDLGIAVIRKARKVAQMVEMDERNQNSSGAQNRKLDLVNTVLRWVAHPVFDDSIFYQLQDDDTSERSTNEMTEFEGVSASQATFGAVEETNLENIINGSHRQSADVSSGLSSTTLQLGFKCPHPACPSNLGFGDEVSRGAAFATEPGDLPTNTYSSGRLRGGPNLKY